MAFLWQGHKDLNSKDNTSGLPSVIKIEEFHVKSP